MRALTSLVTSRKSLRALIGTVAIGGGLWLMWSTYTTPETRAAAFIGAVYGVQKLWSADIDGIATEDAARTATPASQVNVGGTVTNTPAAPTPTEPTPVIPEPTLADHVAEMGRLQRENAVTLGLLLKNIKIIPPAAKPQTVPTPPEPTT